ncbi:MAG: retroviral-like aspartic protease family protein [Turicibacter sp.]|nr:retroviral-like aspartic protease family protein [Turicibacter sp.]
MTNAIKPPIIVKFAENNDGLIKGNIGVLKADRLSHSDVEFKIDTGANLTVINHKHLANLGYTQEFLQNCPDYTEREVTTANGVVVTLKYIDHMSLMFGDREIQNCKIYFSLESDMRTLFGTDFLRRFNLTINYDDRKVLLYKRDMEITVGEIQPQIYSLD